MIANSNSNPIVVAASVAKPRLLGAAGMKPFPVHQVSPPRSALVRQAMELLPAVPILAAGAALLPTDSAVAAVIRSSVTTLSTSLVIPNAVDGMYINVETGVFGTPSGAVPGWDLNPYGTSITTMSWYSLGVSSGCVLGLGQGGTTSAVASLSAGTLISAASVFGGAASSVTAGGWMLNMDNFFGFRFEGGDGLTHYGYGVMEIGATMGARALDSVFYESVAGVGITIPGVTVVPEPTSLLSTLAFVSSGLLLRRRVKTSLSVSAADAGITSGTSVPEPGVTTFAAGAAGLVAFRRFRRRATF